MAKLIKSKIENLTPDDHNFNKGSEYATTLSKNRFGNSVLVGLS